jgi:5-methylcytosine-specific restriction protein A
MPNRPKHPCGYPGCPNLADERYCTTHAKQTTYEYNHYQRDPEINKRYGNTWRKIRAVYITSHPLCELCLREGWYTPAEHVHHVTELSQGGSHDYSNLLSVCKSHHSAIHMRERGGNHVRR